jgi:hypothetical protein
MRTKNSSVVFNLTSQMIKALPIIDAVYLHYGQTAVITSAKDGKHMKWSKHYSGNAIDLRTNFFDKETQIKVTGQLQSQLGDAFDVVLEGNHIHLEFDPK